MISRVLSKIFSSRVFYIIFSLLIATVLWMYVEINENRSITRSIEGIEIVYLNEDIFRDRDLVISERYPQTVALTIDCPRSVASRLNSRNVTAIVDLANITANGYYSLPYTIEYPADISSDSISRPTRSVEYITMTIDIMHKRDIPVEVIYNGGTASSDYIAEAPEVSPQKITVFGPEAIVSRISRAKVQIVRENLSTTYTDELPFTLIDIDGDEIDDMSSLTFNQDKVRVTVQINMLKQVALQIELLYGAGATAQNTLVSIDPPFITISGDPEAISDYNNINLGTIDVTRFDALNAVMFPIVIQNAFTDVSNIKEALVTVEVRGLEIKHLSVSNIHVVNVPRDLEPVIITQSVDIKIRGTKEDLDKLTQDDFDDIDIPLNIRVVADMSDYNAGTYVVPARVNIDGDVGDIGPIGDCKITVSLIRAA